MKMIIPIIIITTTKHTQMHKRIKRRVRSKGNRIEDRQIMKVEESKERKQKTKKKIEAERKIRW